MTSSDDAPVKHLVVDASAFIRRAPLLKMGKLNYTVSGVLAEIRDRQTKEYIANMPFEVIVQEPTTESLKKIAEISRITGDYSSLSSTDMKVLALTHDLYVHHYGRDSINYEVRASVKESTVRDISPKLEARIGFGGQSNKLLQSTTIINADNACSEASASESKCSFGDDDDGEWITQENFDDALLKYNAGAVRPCEDDSATDSKLQVACLSTDFSIQNVLMHMKMNILSLDGLLIKQLKSYILRCRSCFRTTSAMDKEFCPHCGNKSLYRVAVTVDDDGTMHLHINMNQLRVTRGLKYCIPAPKGGKHDMQEKLFEDQRLPQNRIAKIKNSNSDASPFVINDVFSRAAHLGIRSNGGGRNRRRNPNENFGGKRKN